MSQRSLTMLGVFSCALAAAPAWAYDFEIESHSVGQGYQLRWFRPRDGDVLLNRRRFTQSLRLSIWDMLEPEPDPGKPDEKKYAPFELYFTSSLRFDHDFGSFTQGEVTFPTAGVSDEAPAPTAVPELRQGDHQLDVLYAYVGGRDLFGFLDFQLGRQLSVDTLEWSAFDGLKLRVRTPWFFAVEGHGGLVVRGEIPAFVGTANQEPDGTSSARCGAFFESSMMWEEVDECRQRKALMPTFGFAAETVGLRRVQARVSYRRSMSETAKNLYPDTNGQAPSWGINEEKLVASLRGNFVKGGVVPWANVRWNFLGAYVSAGEDETKAIGLIDEAQVGLRLATAQHALTPEYIYSYPTFDSDSIFNIFSTEAYQDWRLTYDVWPARGAFRGYARGYLRKYENSDVRAVTKDKMPTTVDDSVYAKGAGIGGRLRVQDRGTMRGDLFYEDGFGGLRTGGDLSGHYRLQKTLDLEGRTTIILFNEDLLSELEGVSVGVQGGGRWVLADGIALHLLLEENTNRFYTSQLRLFAVLDLAFRPEL